LALVAKYCRRKLPTWFHFGFLRVFCANQRLFS
jgi:hypothetical protein